MMYVSRGVDNIFYSIKLLSGYQKYNQNLAAFHSHHIRRHSVLTKS